MAILSAACTTQAAPVHLVCDIDPQITAKDAAETRQLQTGICDAFAERIMRAAPDREIIRPAAVGQPVPTDALVLALNLTSLSPGATFDTVEASLSWKLGDQGKTSSLKMTVVDAPLSAPVLTPLFDALLAENQPPF